MNLVTDLCIIIVSWNTRSFLEDCLNSLLPEIDSKIVKVIVVDNGSSDGSQAMLETCFPGVQLIHAGANIGFARANNLALPQVASPFVLFLNPDTVVLKGTIDAMLSYIRSNSMVGAIGCKLIYPDGPVQPLGLQWFPTPFREFVKMLLVSDKAPKSIAKLLPYHDPEKSGFVSKIYGAAFLARADVLNRLGGFDERFFMYCEDVDLSRRILDAGWKLYYLSEIQIIHRCGGASEKAHNSFPVLMMCESIAKLMEKYYGRWGKRRYKMLLFVTACVKLMAAGFLKLVYRLAGRPQHRYSASWSKAMDMIEWVLNRKVAVVNA